jgi:hypothetical protein
LRWHVQHVEQDIRILLLELGNDLNQRRDTLAAAAAWKLQWSSAEKVTLPASPSRLGLTPSRNSTCADQSRQA